MIAPALLVMRATRPAGQPHTRLPVIPACLSCGESAPHKGRGLCEPCYMRARRNHTLHQYPTAVTVRSLTQFADDYRILRRRGYTHAQIAETLGYQDWKTVSDLCSRARRQGLLPTPATLTTRVGR